MFRSRPFPLACLHMMHDDTATMRRLLVDVTVLPTTGCCCWRGRDIRKAWKCLSFSSAVISCHWSMQTAKQLNAAASVLALTVNSMSKVGNLHLHHFTSSWRVPAFVAAASRWTTAVCGWWIHIHCLSTAGGPTDLSDAAQTRTAETQVQCGCWNGLQRPLTFGSRAACCQMPPSRWRLAVQRLKKHVYVAVVMTLTFFSYF